MLLKLPTIINIVEFNTIGINLIVNSHWKSYFYTCQKLFLIIIINFKLSIGNTPIKTKL